MGRGAISFFVFGFRSQFESLQYSVPLRDREEAELVSQLAVFVHYVCEGGGRGSASTGGGQRLVYRRLEAANMLHRGTVRLHRLHVLVEDGEDLVVEDLVLPNAVRHLLQRLQEKRRDAVEERNRWQTSMATAWVLRLQGLRYPPRS